MMKNKVRTVGFSILGSERVQESSGGDEEGLLEGRGAGEGEVAVDEGPGVEGRYELGVRRVEAVRKDDDELV